MNSLNDVRIGVIGLGYVGLPLAIEFGKLYPTVGFDINPARIDELDQGRDSTLEASPEELAEAVQLSFSNSAADIDGCNVYVVTVPTPIGRTRRPVLTPLASASELVGKTLEKGDIVIFESTVYPGCTEEFCVPILERASGLIFNEDFTVGYSPERINPGEHRLPSILKVTSGSTEETAEFVDALYKSIVTAGTHLASSVKVAEAAKVIENTQRDVNIALVNELALIFNRLGIDTAEVLDAAATKWNFLPFKPGLVGGHCIGVDPYYLTHKAEEIGYHPEMILAGRRLNDGMASYVASEVIKLMINKLIQPSGAKVLILGLTFKENCPDIRNTKVVDVISELQEYDCQVDVYDPWVAPAEAKHEYDIDLIAEPEVGQYAAIILAVAHDDFRELGADGIHAFGLDDHIVYDIKHLLPNDQVDDRL
ncbi:MAG: Vi polysaccharide biosynthesis UDP-N-acetylglucosamine C-6 dehydrogenase TviB [Gammaproteobacteria bacterium]